MQDRVKNVYLDHVVPAAWNNYGVVVVGGESDARDPIGVTFFLDGVLALGKGVPQLDGLISAARDDLTVVSGESNAQDILQEKRNVNS